MTPDANRILAVVMAADLGGSTLDAGRALEAWPAGDDVMFDVLVSGASSSRMLGLLAAAVASGTVPATAAQAGRCYDAAASALGMDLRRERLLLEVCAVLSGAGIDVRVLKGAASAHLDERDPALRSASDIDLLVRGVQLRGAVERLAADGWMRRFPEPRPGFDGRFSKGVALHRDGQEIDLHRTLTPGAFGLRLPVDDLWAASDELAVGGARIEALIPPHRLLHAAYHAALGAPTPRLTALRDLVHLDRRTDIATDALAVTVQRWGGAAVLERALALTRQHLGIDLVTVRAVVERQPASPRDRRALRPYLLKEDRYARQAVAAVREIHSWSDRRDYVLALALPDRGYLSGRHRSPLGRLRSAFGRAR